MLFVYPKADKLMLLEYTFKHAIGRTCAEGCAGRCGFAICSRDLRLRNVCRWGDPHQKVGYI